MALGLQAHDAHADGSHAQRPVPTPSTRLDRFAMAPRVNRRAGPSPPLHPFVVILSLKWVHIRTGKPIGQVPFEANVELLRLFLAHREDIVEGIEGVLNAQRKPIQYLQ